LPVKKASNKIRIKFNQTRLFVIPVVEIRQIYIFMLPVFPKLVLINWSNI